MYNTFKTKIFIHCFRNENRENIILGELLSAIKDDIDVLLSWERTEFATLHKLYLWSLNNDGAVCYCHLKGVVHGFENPAISDWRQYMSYFVLNHANDCINAIGDGYDACGVDYVQGPAQHFAGNFWWASTKYIRTLGFPHEGLNINGCPSKRHVAEFWIGTGNPKVKCFHQSHIHVYSRGVNRYPKENYENQLV